MDYSIMKWKKHRYIPVHIAYSLLTVIALIEGERRKEIRIGGIFSPTNNNLFSPEHKAFELAIDMVNIAVQQQARSSIKFIGEAEFANQDDDIENIEKVYRLMDKDVVAIIGPVDVGRLQMTQSLCPELQVPQVAPLTSGLAMTFNPCNFDYLLRMSPDDTPQFNAIADLVDYFNWTKVAVLASRDNEGHEGIAAFNEFIIAHDLKITTIEYFVLDPDTMRPNLEIGLEIIKGKGSVIIVLKCQARYVGMVMEEARRMNMINGWVWIFTDNALDEKDLMSRGTLSRDLQGVIGVRQGIGRGPFRKKINEHWKLFGNNNPMKPSVGRVIDSVFVVAKAVQDALRDGVSVSTEKTGVMCNKTFVTKPRPQGRIISKYLRKVQTAGFMNYLRFNNDGLPTHDHQQYDVINLRKDGFVKVGEWDSSGLTMNNRGTDITWTSGSTAVPHAILNVLANKTITVVTFKSSPFTKPKRSNITGKVNGSEFEGAAIDLLERLKEILHFNYVIYTSPDGKVGVENDKTGDWNGVIKELMDENADLAVGPITITSHREKVIEFTQPFMTSGLGAIMAVEDNPKLYFRFLQPFTKDLWAMILGTVIGMGIVNWVFSAVSPFGFYGRCVQPLRINEVKSSYLFTKYYLSFLNSMWSSAAYYLGQGPDGNHPVSASGRAAVAVWWFCITILGATYTANMVAFLTTTRMQTPLRTVRDLSLQTNIEYGIVADSQSQEAFKDSRVPRYQIMWEYMKLRRTMVSSKPAGYERVLQGKFAFIHDEPILMYKARKSYCGKMKLLEGTFGKAHYGFALPKDSPYTNLLSVEILKMQQSGELKNMIDKWIFKETPCLPLDEAEKKKGQSVDTNKMGLENMFGVFIFMFGGIVTGLLLFIIEWIVAACRDLDRRKNKKRTTVVKALTNRVVRICRRRNHPFSKHSRKTDGIVFKANKGIQTIIPTQPSSTFDRRAKPRRSVEL